MSPEENGGNHLPRKERERLRLREEILLAALELFSRQTYEKTSMQQIAERAEVSIGRIYNLFEGKKEIFRELIKLIFERIEGSARTVLETTDDPVERIRRVFGAYLGFCEENRHAMIVIHYENPLKMKGLIEQFISRQIEMMTGLFAAAAQRGAIRGEDPRILANVLFGILDGLVHEMSFGESDYSSDYYMRVFEELFLEPLQVGNDAIDKETR